MLGRSLIVSAAAALSACSSAGGPYPSLQPRSAEAIDPRLQPSKPVNDRPESPALAAQLAGLVGEARSAEAAFDASMANAERLAAAAGASQSESWIQAQEALTTAIAARKPTAEAQADIDALAASALQSQGGIAPNDLRAIQDAAAQVATIARGQTDRIAAIQKRLGL